MKKFVCLVIFVLCSYQLVLTQQINRNDRLVRVNDAVFIEENEKRYMIDRDVVTVKLKPEVYKIRNDFQELRSNRLGYIDLSVPEGVDIEDYVTMLEKTGDFDLVEYNGLGELCFVPNDTRRTEQWYLNSINAYTAWDITTGNSNIIVAVLDTGTDWGHPDLGNGTDGYSNVDATLGWNYLTGNNNVITTNDHGTRVAGIIGAKTHNSRGIAGVSGGRQSSGVTIMPLCVANASGVVNIAVTDDAIIDAVDNGARVINMSFSGPSSTALDDAIAYAVQNNVVLVAASGNGNSSTVSYPASHNDVIAVGAINKNNQRASYSTWGSDYGTNLDVVAPGVGILSTTLNSDYDSDDGTSYAAPQVAGIAALILSIRPDLTQAQVRQTIESNCVKLSGYTFSNNSSHPNSTWNNQVGHGLVNAYAAVNSVTPYISGPSQFCTAATYTIANFSPGATVVWSAPGLSIQANGNTAILTANTAGTYTLSATVTLNGTVIPLTKQILVPGWPLLEFSSSNNLVYHGDTDYYEVLRNYDNSQYWGTLTISTSAGASIQWSQVSGTTGFEWSYFYSNLSSQVTVSSKKTGYLVLKCSVSNSCGTTVTKNYCFSAGPSPFAAPVYPNPATDYFTVKLATESRTMEPYTVQLRHELLGLVRSIESTESVKQVSLTGLPAGMYFVHILLNGETVSRQILWKK